MTLSPTDRTKLSALDPNLTNGVVANPTLRYEVFHELYAYLDSIIADGNAAQGAGAVTTTKLADGSVVTVKLADLGVTTGKVADGAIVTAKLADGSVTTLKIADGSITTAKLAPGSVTLDKLSADIQTSGQPEVALARVSVPSNKTYTTLKARLDEEIGNLSKKTAKSVMEYGAICDGTFRTIASVFPTVTLAQVQALYPLATLSNSSDWYATQKCINENQNVFIDGTCIIDLPIRITSGHKRIFGLSMQTSIIKNISNGNTSVIIGDSTQTEVYSVTLARLSISAVESNRVNSGNGIVIEAASGTVLEDCGVYYHKNGIYSADNNDCWVLRLNNCVFAYNKDNGIWIQHFYSYQKNSITLLNTTCSDNGYNSSNQKYYDLNQSTTDTGHGFKISGTNITMLNCNAERNSGAGVYLGGSSIEQVMAGVTITGSYFEPNRLADVYIDNNLNIFSGSINGNYFGSEYISGSIYKGVFIKNKKNLTKDTNIENNYQYYNASKDTYALNGNLTFTKTNTSLFSKDRIIVSKGKYELSLEYSWNKITSSSSMLVGLGGLDLDENPIVKDTTPSYALTSYATLTQTIQPTDTILHFDSLTGFDITSYSLLVLYDTVLSDGTVVGTDYSANYLSKSNVASVDLVNKTITLTSAIGKTIASGTKCSLNSSSGTSAAIDDYISLSSAATTATKKYDISNISYQKYLYYLQPLYIYLNANDVNDNVKITRLRFNRETSVTWSTPTLLNGWTTGLTFIGYAKDDLGNVRVQGAVSASSLTLNSVIFTLPVGLRPSSTLVFTGARDDFPDVVIYVQTNGDVKYVKGGTAGAAVQWVSLSGISFRV